ncbi:MAG: PEP-utilizing enzyme, partial [Pseudomonadota bacterium]
ARMAVIIQEMIPAEASGVLFCVDPLMRQGRHIHVEITAGLGEAIVSGKVRGHTYRVDRENPDLISRDSDVDLIDSGTLKELCSTALAVEEDLGSPQDMEFAVLERRIYWLQTRPMTWAHEPNTEEIDEPGKPSLLDKMIKPFIDERYAIAPRPLDNLVFTRLVGGHIYAIRDCGGIITPEDEDAFRKKLWHQAYRLPRVRRRWLALPLSVYRLFQYLGTDLRQWWDGGPRAALGRISSHEDLRPYSPEDLLGLAEEILRVWEDLLNRRLTAAGCIRADAWLRYMVTLAVGPRKSGEVMAGLMSGRENPTFVLNQELWELSRLAREHPSVLSAVRELSPERLETTAKGREFLEAFRRFMEKYGHREGSCWYITTPTWRHDPMQVWGLLAGMVEADDRTGRPETVRNRRQAHVTLVEKRLRLVPGLALLFKWLLSRLCALHEFRENSHFDLTRPLACLQDIFAECARRLKAEDLLELEEDIGYLTYEEVRCWLTGNPPRPDQAWALIDRRRAVYRVVNARWQEERFGNAQRADELKGIAAGPGVARGKVRIIRGEHEFGRFQAREIIVSPYTNPAWTPLFATTTAVVTETGGVSSHAAIVAREYGIPAVMSVPGATRVLKDGQDVLVDGNKGIVYRLGEQGISDPYPREPA